MGRESCASSAFPTVADRVVQGAEAGAGTDLRGRLSAGLLRVPAQAAEHTTRSPRSTTYGTQGYRWVLDADIEACFDSIDHPALMDRVRRRVKDKRVLRLVKAFLKAGVLTELGDSEDTHTGTPQGGILSPLLANIALSVLDEHLHGPWQPAGRCRPPTAQPTPRQGPAETWRIVRYADDFVVLVHGTRDTSSPARTVAEVLDLWVCGCQRPRPRWCT